VIDGLQVNNLVAIAAKRPDLHNRKLYVDIIHERLDLLQFHAWSYADPSYLDVLFELQELRRRGLILHLGLTNVDAAHLKLILDSGIEVVSSQVSFSLLDRRARDGGLLEVCRERGVSLLAYGTLAGGFLSDRWPGALTSAINSPLRGSMATTAPR